MANADRTIEQFIPRVVRWHAEHRRPLPWRDAPTAYHVWVSEIMLQQTRIEAVLGYYSRFLAELPDVRALAEVPEDRLLKLWEGLGYYSRARNLKKAAQIVAEQHGGELPRTAAELKKLPGIGDYTAGAIASIAWGEPEPAVDGNVLRVLSRLLADERDVLDPRTRSAMAALLREHYPAGREAGLLTEGIMELGETVCIPNGAPKCGSCPAADLCAARNAGTVERFPVKAPPRARRAEERTVLLLLCGEKFALRRREEKGLLSGLWEFPNLPGTLEESAVLAAASALGAEPTGALPRGAAKHIFTHIEWHMTGWLVPCAREAEGLLWLTPAEIRADYSIPTAFSHWQKLIEKEEA